MYIFIYIFQGLQPGEAPYPEHKDEYNIGDVFLGMSYLADRCKEDNMDLEDAMAVGLAGSGSI